MKKSKGPLEKLQSKIFEIIITYVLDGRPQGGGHSPELVKSILYFFHFSQRVAYLLDSQGLEFFKYSLSSLFNTFLAILWRLSGDFI